MGRWVGGMIVPPSDGPMLNILIDWENKLKFWSENVLSKYLLFQSALKINNTLLMISRSGQSYTSIT